MRAATTAIALFSLFTSCSIHADIKRNAVGVGYWFDQNAYVEIFHKTDLGIHPQVFVGSDVIGVNAKTDPLYSKYGIELAPFFGFGVSESDMEGLLGVEFNRKFHIQSQEIDTYFRFNTDFEFDKDYMVGIRYFY